MTTYLDALTIRHLFMPKYIYTWQAHGFKAGKWQRRRIMRVSFQSTFGARNQHVMHETYFAWVKPQ